MDTRAFGIDLSRWDFSQPDGIIIAPNWLGILEALNPTFVAGRATVSWAYVDPVFLRLWPQIKVPRFAYGVIYPDQPVKSQTDHFLSTVGDNWELAYPVQDAELDRGVPVNQITDAILQWQANIQAAIGKRPLLYSRAGWIDQYTRNDGWRAREIWWLANYLNDATREHPGPPTMPNGVDTYLIHQTCQKYPVPSGVTARLYTDSDRWNGTLDDVHKFFGQPIEQPVDVTAELAALKSQVAILEAGLIDLRQIHNNYVDETAITLAAAVERIVELERWRKS